MRSPIYIVFEARTIFFIQFFHNSRNANCEAGFRSRSHPEPTGARLFVWSRSRLFGPALAPATASILA